MVNRLPVLAPDVKEMLNQWRPTTWDDFDVWILDPLLPTIRGWVEQAKPGNAVQTRGFLLAASGMAVWAYQSFGNIDQTVVFHPSNIEQWTMTVCADRSMRWREVTRSRLRTLGKVVNPDGFPAPTRKVGKQQIARPYTTLDEKVFRLMCGLPGRTNRSQRLWICCGSLGAGLRGNEITAARTSDIENVGGERLAMRVRGRNRRLVPIRNAYTDLVRAATDASVTDRFFPTNGRNGIYETARRLDPALSFRRARSTWLLAHLTAGTSLAVLRMIAGPLSANTLDGLLPFATNSLDEETAALGALGA